MWLALLTIYTFKILCMFIFIVYCVVTFLMVMHNPRTEELGKCVILEGANTEAEFPFESCHSVDEKLKVSSEYPTERKHPFQRSHFEIKSDPEARTSTCRNRYRSLVTELKRDVRKTEGEVKTLQNHISSLSVRREALRSEVSKEQENFHQMLNNFNKKLDNKKTPFCRFKF